jgi:Holliday junction resolvase RusA-like endonuclease
MDYEDVLALQGTVNQIHRDAEPRLITMDEPNAVRFTLPSMPISVNRLYQIIYRERRVELKPEARRWKTQAKEHMPPWTHTPGQPVRVDVHMEFKRLTKSERVRTKDPANYLKLILDAVAERYGFNDCLIWSGSWSSAHANKEQVIVTVTEMEEHKP